MPESTPSPPAVAESRLQAQARNGQAPACVVCGSRESARPYPARLPWLARCRGCGLMGVDPQPSDEELAEIYSGEFYGTFGYDEQNDLAYRAAKQANAARLLELAERYFRPGRLLDVGSALGDMLVAARQRNWEAWGVEPNAYACEVSGRTAPGAVFRSTIEQFESDGGPFDLITCTEVLEHLRRPDAALVRMRGLLRPGGGLLLTMPDAGCLMSRLRGFRWVHYHRDHLWYFDRRALTRLTAGAGLEVIACRRAHKVFNLRYIFGILAANKRSPWIQRMSRLGLHHLPARVLAHPLPPLGEGLLLLACRPKTVEGASTTQGREPPDRAGFQRQ